MRVRVWLAVFCCLLLQGGAVDPATVVALAVRDGAIVLEAPPGAHLKRAFLAVELQPGSPGRLEAGPLPPPTGQDELGDGIWRGPVVVPVRGEGLRGTVGLRVTYQLCTEGVGGVCYPPTDRLLQVEASRLARAPRESWSLLWSFLGAFGAGLAASLTPCVYPMVPITMAVVGATGGGRLQGLLRSLALVAGMALTYTALGVLAAATGQAFGAWAQRPVFLVPVSLLFGAFALSLFGAFELRLPASLQTRLQGGGARRGWFGAFLAGLVLGPLSAPCVGPIAGTILLAIATAGQVLLGALQLFTFALGMGVLFVAVGTFSASLPRSGAWLIGLKRLLGLVALGFAVWNLRTLTPVWLDRTLWAAVLLAAAWVFGIPGLARRQAAAWEKGFGLAALGGALVVGSLAVTSGLAVLPRSETWRALWREQDYEGALTAAKAGGKLVVVDVGAEWCAECKELDEKTWPDPGIAAWISGHAVAVRLDTDKVRKDLARPLRILGYPTVLVLDADGRELRRILGFQKPAEMLAFLEGR